MVVEGGRGTSRAADGLDGYPVDLALMFEQYLGELDLPVEGAASGLKDAMTYSLMAGGKRIRPILALATQRALGRDPHEVLPFACAVEMIHTYSLIHDDLPAMDDDDLRRGMPTLHRARGEATAILAGDALYAEAMRHLLANQVCEPGNLIAAASHLAEATGLGGMVAGQYLDVEGNLGDGAESLLLLHSLKTGALIRACSECVVLIAGDVTDAESEAVRSYALNIGVLFQIIDDILDVTGDDAELGKPRGSDERKGKRTYVTQFGLNGAGAMAGDHHRAAREAIEPLGDAALELVAIADYVATRTR